MTPSLTIREAASIHGPGIRRGHTDKRRARPLAPPGQRAATDPFPAAGGTQVQKPAPRGDFKVPQIRVRLDRVIPSDLRLLDGAVDEITAAIDRTACWEGAESISLVMREALVNAMVHGNHCDPTRTVRVSISVNEDGALLIVVKDSGSGFDPSGLPNPIADENLLANHGRGIFLMKQLMDEVDFRFDHGTEVRMRRRRQWLE
jgi:anti-sigma regulatory factor (Ser/Thr protein kinase)